MKQNSITERTQIREDMPYWLEDQFYRKCIGNNDKPIRAEMVSRYISKYIIPKSLVEEALNFFELMKECSLEERIKVKGITWKDYSYAHIQRINQYQGEK